MCYDCTQNHTSMQSEMHLQALVDTYGNKTQTYVLNQSNWRGNSVAGDIKDIFIASLI